MNSTASQTKMIATLLMSHLLNTLTLTPIQISHLTNLSIYNPLVLAELETFALRPAIITREDNSTLRRNIDNLLEQARTNPVAVPERLHELMQEPDRNFNWLVAWSVKIQTMFWGLRDPTVAAMVLQRVGCEAEAEIGVAKWRIVLIRVIRNVLGVSHVELEEKEDEEKEEEEKEKEKEEEKDDENGKDVKEDD